MASASDDTTARVWDMGGNEVGNYKANVFLNSIAFFPDRQHLVLGCLNNTVGIIDWRTGSLVHLVRNIHTWSEVIVLPKSRNIVSAMGNDIRIWSRQKPVEDFSTQTDFSYSVEKLLMGHNVCAEPCPLLYAHIIRAILLQSRRQKTTGG